jgi:hypothetical protein
MTEQETKIEELRTTIRRLRIENKPAKIIALLRQIMPQEKLNNADAALLCDRMLAIYLAYDVETENLCLLDDDL